MTDQAQLLPGTLDLLILRAVSLGPLHGYGILLRIGQISGSALLIEQGALYPALFRLVRMQAASALFRHLGRDGILARAFPNNPAWLRFGRPGNEEAWARLENSLSRFRERG